MAVDKLDEDEKGVSSIDTLGGRQELLIVSESGLYALALRCRDAMTPGSPAHRFRKWVTADILRTIPQDGRYGAFRIDEKARLIERGGPVLGMSMYYFRSRMLWRRNASTR